MLLVKYILKFSGALKYYTLPKLKNGCGGPFNAQTFRQQIFLELIRNINFSAIVETGTYRGTTAAYMHEFSQLPVYTVELSPEFYGYAKTRFRLHKKISLSHADSRAFLRRLSADADLIGKQIFFYLDAHWGEELPLLEEIEIIFRNWRKAVIMIDDFKVPDDKGYSYDDFGPGKALTLDYLSPLNQLGFATFFPSKRADLETGKKRGCVVIARSPDLIEKLKELDSLVLYTDKGLASTHSSEPRRTVVF